MLVSWKLVTMFSRAQIDKIYHNVNYNNQTFSTHSDGLSETVDIILENGGFYMCNRIPQI